MDFSTRAGSNANWSALWRLGLTMGRSFELRRTSLPPATIVPRNVKAIEDSFEVLCSEMDPSKGENHRSYQIVDRVSAAQPLGMPSYNFQSCIHLRVTNR